MLAVILGAFGAHALRRKVPADLPRRHKPASSTTLARARPARHRLVALHLPIPRSSLGRVADARGIVSSREPYVLAVTGVRWSARSRLWRHGIHAAWALFAWAVVRG